MTLKELRKKSIGDLHSLLAKDRNSLRELRFKDAGKQLKTVHEIKKVRVEIAQILTILNKPKEDKAQEGKLKEKKESEKKIKTGIKKEEVKDNK